MSSRQNFHGRYSRGLLASAIAAGLGIGSAPDCAAVLSVWSGGAGNWQDTAKWTPGVGVPTSTIDAQIGTSATVALAQFGAVHALNIQSGSVLNIQHGFHLDVFANSVIDGALNLQSTGTNATTYLRADTDLTFSGAGAIVLSNSPNNQIISSPDPVSGPRRITLGSGLTVRGGGSLGVGLATFTNLGTIQADQATPLIVQPFSGVANAFVNQGVVGAANGGTLQLAESTTYTNTGGLIRALDGSTVDLAQGVQIVGGTLASSGTGKLQASGVVTLQNVTLDANSQLNILSSKRIDLQGPFTNNGTVRPTGSSGATDLRILGDVTIGGTGSIVLSNSLHRIYAESATQRLTLGPGQTVTGTGNLGTDLAKITNQGTIVAAAGNALTIDASNFTDGFLNQGAIRVDLNGTINAPSGAGFIQNTANASTLVNGTLTVPSFQLQAGTFGGNGSLSGSVVNSGGIVAPGASAGHTTITGSYTQGVNGTLRAEINGTQQGISYDWLQVGGNAQLDGTLDLIFGFTPAAGTSFILLTTGSGNVSGRFGSIVKPVGWTITTTYDLKDVTLTVAAVPESETYVLMLTGFGLVAWAVKRRQRKAQNRWPGA